MKSFKSKSGEIVWKLIAVKFLQSFYIVNTLSLIFAKYFCSYQFLSLMKYIKGEDRRQYVLFPAWQDEY